MKGDDNHLFADDFAVADLMTPAVHVVLPLVLGEWTEAPDRHVVRVEVGVDHKPSIEYDASVIDGWREIKLIKNSGVFGSEGAKVAFPISRRFRRQACGLEIP